LESRIAEPILTKRIAKAQAAVHIARNDGWRNGPSRNPGGLPSYHAEIMRGMAKFSQAVVLIK